MERLISLLCVPAIILSLFVVNVNAVGLDSEKSLQEDEVSYSIGEETVFPTDGAAPVYATYSKNHYQNNEEILISIVVPDTAQVTDFDYSATGFILNNVIEIKSTSISVSLKYDGISADPLFTISVLLNNTETYECSIYGIQTDKGLFISKDSVDMAWDAYFYSGVLDGTCTVDEYNAALQEYYKNLSNNGIQFTTTRTEPDPNMATTYASQYTTVTGNASWIDDSNVVHPLQYNRIDVYDVGYQAIVQTVYTKQDGTFSISLYNDLSSRILQLILYPGGENTMVITENGGSYSTVMTTLNQFVPGETITLNGTIDMSTTQGQAFQVSQAANVAAKYAKTMNGSGLSYVNIVYPDSNASSCYYDSNTRKIHIRSTTSSYYGLKNYSSWDVIMHEYGHHVQSVFGITNNPGGSHSFDADFAATKGKDKGIRLAWGEAYASVFSGMAQKYYASSLQNIRYVGDSAYHSYNGANINYESTGLDLGEACEGTVVGVLWDLYDSATESHDTITISHSQYWNIIKYCSSVTLSEFVQYIYSVYPEYTYGLALILSYYDVAASNVTWNTSGSTPKITWTANGIESMPNNKFDLIIYDKNNQIILRRNNITSTSYTLTSSEYNIIKSNSQIWIYVIAYQTDSPSTGGFFSQPIQITLSS